MATAKKTCRGRRNCRTDVEEDHEMQPAKQASHRTTPTATPSRPTKFGQLPAALSRTLCRLKRGALLVYTTIATAAGPKAFTDGIRIPSSRLAELTGLSRAGLKRARHELRRAGCLRTRPGSGRLATWYRLLHGEEELPTAGAAYHSGGGLTREPPHPTRGLTDDPPGGSPVSPPRPCTSRGKERVQQLLLFDLEAEARETAARTRIRDMLEQRVPEEAPHERQATRPHHA